MRLTRRKLAAGCLLAATSLAATTAVATTGSSSARGPSTSTSPYLLPAADGVHIKSLLTVDDEGSATNGYEMVGIPDGLGAVKAPNGRDFTLLMNHELRANQGVEREHGERGAFVSKLRIDKHSWEVEEGSDLITDVRYWNYATGAYQDSAPAGQNAAFARWCSSSITDPGQLYNPHTGNGYRGQIYFGNEEDGDTGRSFGVTTAGLAQHLPALGLFQWENTLAAPTRGDVTMTMGQEDAAAGQLWIYVGTKTGSGDAFERAGLTNGTNFVLDLEDQSVDSDGEFRGSYGKNVPTRFGLEEVGWNQSGAAQNAEALADGLTLNRIEDGAWDPRHPNDFYFVTTEGAPFAGRDGGGVWRVRFDDIEQPSEGGTIKLLLDGSEEPFLNKPDNVDMDKRGHLLIQEDPGNNAHLARIVAYDVDSGERGVVAEFDPALFAPGGFGFITQDEESSGIIDASELLGDGWFLLDAQIHTSTGLSDPTAQVEHGQLLAMRVRGWRAIY